jgi:hypothetical protein
MNANGARLIWVSTHTALLIGAAGLLGMALLLEGGLTSGLVADRHGHEHLPVTVHGLALVSVLLSLWPIARRILVAAKLCRLDWRVAIVAALLTALAMGYIMVGAGAAFLFSLGSLALRQRTGRASP